VRVRDARKLKVMADYTAFPVWDCGEPWNELGLGQAMIEPEDLRISASLRERLLAWAAVYDRQDAFADVWNGPPSESDWVDEGRALARQLQHELGSAFEVVYFNEFTADEEPV
jgi:hypothetical protein